MDNSLRISTLGGLSITLGNKPFTQFVSRKAEALLVYLACQPNEHLREVLAVFFWGDLAQDQAMSNFRVALSNLNKHFEPYLLINRHTVQMSLEGGCQVDINEIRNELSTVERYLTRGEVIPQPVSQRFGEALDLYRGDFLAGFHVRDCKSFEDWKLLEQEHIQTRVSEVLHPLVRYYLDQRQYASGIRYAQRLVSIDPLSEQAHLQLMQMFLQSEQRNQALAQYETYRSILKTELGVEPSESIKDLYLEIQRGRTVPQSPPIKRVVNLPILSDPFIGRKIELAEIGASLMHPHCRLLTLLGLGGAGKTRLAIEAASQNQFFKNGIYFVGCLPISSGDLIVPTMASALKISLEGPQSPDSQLIEYLADQEILFVLDNLEHLVKEISILGQVLASTRWVKMLATSRERLNLQQEWIVEVKGMGIPPNAEYADADQYPAVQLFAQVAQRIFNKFSLSENLRYVIEICQFVEGLPLGIELAAGWIHLLSCQQILQELRQSDREILSTPTQNIPDRHRNITRLFDYSWKLMSLPERSSLMKLSIFTNTFSAEAALSVANASLAMLSSLNQKSLIYRDSSGRYGLHRLLQRYVSEKLIESGEEEDTSERYCEYFIKRSEELYRADSGQPLSIDTFDTDFADMQKAMGWALQHGRSALASRMIDAVVFFWKKRGYMGKYKR
jgi:predicted ATPase/DNA-binding SARP family transcriptional activator